MYLGILMCTVRVVHIVDVGPEKSSNKYSKSKYFWEKQYLLHYVVLYSTCNFIISVVSALPIYFLTVCMDRSDSANSYEPKNTYHTIWLHRSPNKMPYFTYCNFLMVKLNLSYKLSCKLVLYGVRIWVGSRQIARPGNSVSKFACNTVFVPISWAK